MSGEMALGIVMLIVFGIAGVVGYRKKKSADIYTAGVWTWGILAFVLSFTTVFIIAFGVPKQVYIRVRDSASAIGAVVAASALAWSFFYKSVEEAKEKKKEAVKTAVLEKLEEKMNHALTLLQTLREKDQQYQDKPSSD